jgi:hypothetical protein
MQPLHCSLAVAFARASHAKQQKIDSRERRRDELSKYVCSPVISALYIYMLYICEYKYIYGHISCIYCMDAGMNP